MTTSTKIKLGIAGVGVLGLVYIGRDKKLSADKKLKLMAIVVGTTGGTIAGVNIYDNWKDRKYIKEHGKTECNGVNLSSKADNIYDALWQYMFGTMEDEERAVRELLQVPKSCIEQLALIYNGKYKKNLFEDFSFFVGGSDYEKVRHLLE